MGAGPVGPVTADDEAFLGLPGLLSPEQTAALLAQRDSHLRRRVDAAGRLRTGDPTVPAMPMRAAGDAHVRPPR